MFIKMLSAIFGTKQSRDLKELNPIVQKVSALEKEIESLSDRDFPIKTQMLKEEIQQKKKKLTEVIPYAFALVREAAKRSLGMRHYDVQLIGGLALTQGRVSEMKTGEGKTLTSTLSAYARALEGKGVHIITVNEYLAKRDMEWMRPLYEFLGITLGCIDAHEAGSLSRREAYDADITFGTNNEFGFDYLRDNMVLTQDHKVMQRDYYFCIIDEVDSVLIDEARTPLIISGPSESNIEKYYTINQIIPKLKEAKLGEDKKELPGSGDYIFDRRDKNIYITEDGAKKLEQFLNIDSLFELENVETLHHVNQALRAHNIMTYDVDYLVEDGQIVIIDEFTGRKMLGRRFSDGLHQAIEAKEKVVIQMENQTLASITFQNYFRMYKILSGMTGTADTEAFELKKIYDVDVVVIPTNKPMLRMDYNDIVYRTKREKYNAIATRVKEAYQKGQPILVGTLSVESSEELSKVFSKNALPHEILNAKNHLKEANIIKKAGQKKSITVATNMAGRGTDIKLGEEVTDLGGLLIVGSERAESRRVDNQLRGRSGRQGDVGESQFYLSLEDDLMLRFGSDRISNMMTRMGMEEGEDIQHSMINRAIENAQKKVENRNFDIRKHLLEYDNVMNEQRKLIYNERKFFLKEDQLQEKILQMIKESFEQQFYEINQFTESVNDELYLSTTMWFKQTFSLDNILSKEDFLNLSYENIEKKYVLHIQKVVISKFERLGREIALYVQRTILLNTLDTKWKDHLLQMDQLREGINLRSYAEKKPIVEFKKEGYSLFEEMIDNFKYEIMKIFIRADFVNAGDIEQKNYGKKAIEKHDRKGQFKSFGVNRSSSKATATPRVQAMAPKVPKRNDPCHCGSTKKYKNCCGSL